MDVDTVLKRQWYVSNWNSSIANFSLFCCFPLWLNTFSQITLRQVHWMIRKWPWILQGQIRYPIYVLVVQPSSKFQCFSLHSHFRVPGHSETSVVNGPKKALSATQGYGWRIIRVQYFGYSTVLWHCSFHCHFGVIQVICVKISMMEHLCNKLSNLLLSSRRLSTFMDLLFLFHFVACKHMHNLLISAGYIFMSNALWSCISWVTKAIYSCEIGSGFLSAVYISIQTLLYRHILFLLFGAQPQPLTFATNCTSVVYSTWILFFMHMYAVWQQITTTTNNNY